MGLLSDDSAEIRTGAASALGAIDDPRAVKPLSALLKDERPCVQVAAARALTSIDTPEALAAIDKAAESADLFYVADRYKAYIQTGNEDDELLLILALGRYGHDSMAAVYYWSGNDRLKDAAMPFLRWPGDEYMRAARPDRTPDVKWGVKKDAKAEQETGEGNDSAGR
ncbi:MAG: HEAT repeat domain-containing protein [Planctomycetota bacterium]